MDPLYFNPNELAINAIKSKRIIRDPQISKIVSLFSHYDSGDIDESSLKLSLSQILEDIEIDGAKTAFEVMKQYNSPEYWQ